MRSARLLSTTSVIGLVLLLVSVRAFETHLFFDPLLDYFQTGFQTRAIPEVPLLKIISSTSMRYGLNMILSLLLIWFLFKRISFVKAALWVYLFAFVILMSAFVFLLYSDSDLGKMALFYTRRFLIHPILLFILVAGFYFFRDKMPLEQS